jgi:hypothetical protein
VLQDPSLLERAKRWGFAVSGFEARFEAQDFAALLLNSVKLAYFDPPVYAAAPMLLPVVRILKALRWNR